MRRFTMVAVLAVGTVLGVLASAAGSTAAWADGPQHVKSTFPFDPPPLPSGAFCNFTYGEAAAREGQKAPARSGPARRRQGRPRGRGRPPAR